MVEAMRRNVENFSRHGGRIQFRITGNTLDEKFRALDRPHCVLHVRLVTLGIIHGEWFPEWRVDYRYLHDNGSKAQNEVEVGVYLASAGQLCGSVNFEN